MRINTNLIALNTKNQLKKNNKITSNIMEKLSSGKRINKAADDAAGLAISQKMRAQIRGLDQASENAQDGISLVQTAEGGLSTINNPHLARLRELAIQSANDTLVDSDREKIQMEAEEIVDAIDDIANNTEFNTIKLLSPPVNISEGETKFAKTDVAFIVDVSASMGGIIDNVVNNLDVFTNTMKSQGVDVNLGLISYSDINIGEDITTWDLMSDVDIFKENMKEMRNNLLGGGDSPESGLEGINKAFDLNFRTDSTKQFVLVTDATVHDGPPLSSFDIESTADKLNDNNIKLHIVGPESVSTQNQLKKLSDPTNGIYSNINSDFSSELKGIADIIVDDSGIVSEELELKPLILQIGANSGDTFKIDLFDARSESLEIEALDLTTRVTSNEAILKIDNAIGKVVSGRSKFGAYTNRLEHIIRNVDNASENLQNAESRITDADMAKQAMKLAKNDILVQASQSMLAQANNLPQGVLQLLK